MLVAKCTDILSCCCAMRTGVPVGLVAQINEHWYPWCPSPTHHANITKQLEIGRLQIYHTIQATDKVDKLI